MKKLMKTHGLSMIFCEGWKPSVSSSQQHARVIAYKNETCWPSRIALLICSNTYYRSSCSNTVGWNILLTFNKFSCLSCCLQFRANSILVTSSFKPLKMIKSGPIFDQAAKLGKASRDAYNPCLWLILLDLLKNWVAESVSSDVNDFIFITLWTVVAIGQQPFFNLVLWQKSELCFGWWMHSRN